MFSLYHTDSLFASVQVVKKMLPRFLRYRNQTKQPLYYSCSTMPCELVLAGQNICERVNSASVTILTIIVLPSCHFLYCSIRPRKALTTKRLIYFPILEVQNYNLSTSLISTVLQQCSRNQAVKPVTRLVCYFGYLLLHREVNIMK